MTRKRLFQSTPFQTPGDLLPLELNPADGISVGLRDLVRIEIAPGIPFIGRVCVVKPDQVMVEDRNIGVRGWARIEDVQIILKASALEAVAASA